jgi:hypothetical protein
MVIAKTMRPLPVLPPRELRAMQTFITGGGNPGIF